LKPFCRKSYPVLNAHPWKPSPFLKVQGNQNSKPQVRAVLKESHLVERPCGETYPLERPSVLQLRDIKNAKWRSSTGLHFPYPVHLRHFKNHAVCLKDSETPNQFKISPL